ncbi:MAG TPA: RidA family protein [Gammaproteobacteria bacterium]
MANKKIEIFNPEQLGSPLGLYKQIARVRASEFVFIAGQLAVNKAGEVVGTGDFEAQMIQVFENIRAGLEAVDAGFSDIARFTTYLVHASYIDSFMKVRQRLFPELFADESYPPNTLVVVQRLVREEFLIEVDTVVAR